MKQRLITSTAELDILEEAVVDSAAATVEALKKLFNEKSGIDVLALLKFAEAGRDPLEPTRTLNFVEQLNQSFTYLASIRAARWLLTKHPECAPLILNLGTAPGPDIQSKCGRFVAETFAATHPSSNDKLRSDVAKVRECSADHKFVFFLSPAASGKMVNGDVTVIQLEHPAVEMVGSMRKDA